MSTQEAIVLFKTLRRAGFAFEAWVDREDAFPPGATASMGRSSPRPCGGIEQPAAISLLHAAPPAWAVVRHARVIRNASIRR